MSRYVIKRKCIQGPEGLCSFSYAILSYGIKKNFNFCLSLKKINLFFIHSNGITVFTRKTIKDKKSVKNTINLFGAGYGTWAM